MVEGLPPAHFRGLRAHPLEGPVINILWGQLIVEPPKVLRCRYQLRTCVRYVAGPPAQLVLVGGEANKKISPKTVLFAVRDGRVEKAQTGLEPRRRAKVASPCLPYLVFFALC